jgi:hypothetical protein
MSEAALCDELTDRVQYLLSDYTEAEVAAADVYLFMWSLYSEEDGTSAAQRVDLQATPGARLVCLQQDNPAAVISLGRELNRHNWQVDFDMPADGCITLVAMKHDMAQQMFAFPEVLAPKRWNDVTCFGTYEGIVTSDAEAKVDDSVLLETDERLLLTGVVAECSDEKLTIEWDSTEMDGRKPNSSVCRSDVRVITCVYVGSSGREVYSRDKTPDANLRGSRGRWREHIQRLRSKRPHTSLSFQQAVDSSPGNVDGVQWRCTSWHTVAQGSTGAGAAMIAQEQDGMNRWIERRLLGNATKIADQVDPQALWFGCVQGLRRSHAESVSGGWLVGEALAKVGKDLRSILTLSHTEAKSIATSVGRLKKALQRLGNGHDWTVEEIRAEDWCEVSDRMKRFSKSDREKRRKDRLNEAKLRLLAANGDCATAIEPASWRRTQPQRWQQRQQMIGQQQRQHGDDSKKRGADFMSGYASEDEDEASAKKKAKKSSQQPSEELMKDVEADDDLQIRVEAAQYQVDQWKQWQKAKAAATAAAAQVNAAKVAAASAADTAACDMAGVFGKGSFTAEEDRLIFLVGFAAGQINASEAAEIDGAKSLAELRKRCGTSAKLVNRWHNMKKKIPQ